MTNTEKALEIANKTLLSIVEKYDAFEKQNPGISNPISLSAAVKATRALNEIEKIIREN